MAHRVTGDQYFDLDGQLNEIKRQLRQPGGYPYTPDQLSQHLQAAIEGRFTVPKKLSHGLFKFDKRTDGWELLEDIPQTLTPAGFEPVPFLKNGEGSVKGDVMALRALELNANFGQHDAEYLLENQHLIPEEYQGKYYLVFPGTKWRDADGHVYVPYLYWNGDRWYLNFNWLDNDFNGNDRLVRPRNSLHFSPVFTGEFFII